MTTNSTTIHGVFLDVFGLGVLLLGNSGIGKSEIALGLISRGHRIIADDAVTFQLNQMQDQLIGSCPDILQDFIEVRGLGVLNVRAIYGDSAIRPNAPLQLIVNLIDVSDEIFLKSNRLFGIHGEKDILGLTFNEVTLPVGPGRNISVLIESAVRNHNIRLKGYNAAKDFTDRQKAFLDSKADEFNNDPED